MASVRIWTVSLQGFVDQVELSDPEETEVLDEFRVVLRKVLGEELFQQGFIKVATFPEQYNPHLCVEGTRQSLKRLVTERQPMLMKHYFRIEHFTDVGFEANIGLKDKDIHPFVPDTGLPSSGLERKYVLYVRTGRYDHACMKTQDEFVAERLDKYVVKSARFASPHLAKKTSRTVLAQSNSLVT